MRLDRKGPDQVALLGYDKAGLDIILVTEEIRGGL